MSDIIDITAFRSPAAPEEDGRQALLARLTQVKEQIARLDLEEPEDMASEAYEIWGGRREALEDLADDLMDRLDELDS
ncbi:MAG: hypothetical protein KH704_00095 [Clostridiales bacterium]|nr:hypothetical protein [Clostridiales bacterium]